MRKIIIVCGAISILLGTLACNNKQQTMASYLDLSNIDKTVNPKEDFYDYACGGWMKNNPLPAEYARYGSFDQLAANNQQQIRELIEQLSASTQEVGSVGIKIGTLYSLGMDTAKIEQQGITPIKEDLEQINALTDVKSILQEVAKKHRSAIFPFFTLYVSADDMNSDMNIVNLHQGGLGMTDRDYYLLDDEHTTSIRASYVAHLEKMFGLAGYAPIDAKKNAKSVMIIETHLAKASSSRVDLRDPHKNYHKLSIAEVKKLAPKFDWDGYLSAMNLGEITHINVQQTNFLSEVNNIIVSAEVINDLMPSSDLIDLPTQPVKANAGVFIAGIGDLKAYLAWNVINESASFLNGALEQQNFDFYGRTLSGKQEMQPRWKRVVNTVNNTLGEAVGELYVNRYFPAESKMRMDTLVLNLQAALKDRIEGLDWMTAATKQKALEKLAAFRVKIGYPDKWRDYSNLAIADDSYWANICRSNRFEMDYMLAKAGKPVDKSEWLMTPQTVNAYYNPSTNEICFPAGILQAPFFFAKGDDALNYGAIGVVIGHEMTHGFDDQGRQYDKDGNLRDWWTAEDTEKFNQRADALAAYFDKIVVLDSVHANGRFTLGENIADQGGLTVSYLALQKALKQHPATEKLDNLTPEQRFYLAYANVWATNIRPEEVLRRTKEDEHSLGRWRVNGTLPHLHEFHKAFEVADGNKMFLPESERVIIW